MNALARRTAVVPFSILLVACGSDPMPADVPVVDARGELVTVRDASSDSALADTGTALDASPGLDVSPGLDSGPGVEDGVGSDGQSDAGATPDMGVIRDVGAAPDVMRRPDSGSVADSGSMPDSGPRDGGTCVSDKLVPLCGGVWWGMSHGAAITTLETQVGRQFDIAHEYHVDTQAFPTAMEQRWSDEGRLLLLNWKPSSAVNGWRIAASGTIDTQIAAEADRIRAFGRPMFLALYHEPENNLPGGSDTQAGTAAEYVAMWHHVRAIFDARSVTNVVWVWNVMGFSGHAAHYTSGDLYPGDSYVDWIAYDPYCGNPASQPWATTVNSGASASWPGFYQWVTTAHPGMPLMLGEYGAQEVASDATAKGRWFTDEITALRTTRSAIRAAVYWNGPMYDIASSTASLSGYTAAGHDPLVNPSHR